MRRVLFPASIAWLVVAWPSAVRAQSQTDEPPVSSKFADTAEQSEEGKSLEEEAAGPAPTDPSDATGRSDTDPPSPNREDDDSAEGAPEDATKRRARAHFERGLALLRDEAFHAALVEFKRSRELYPTLGNALNTAVCLRELGRYDEAMEVFGEIVASERELAPDERARIENEIRLLEGLLGSLELDGLLPGAQVFVDGRDRGTAPFSSPLPVSAGTRVIRVVTPGWLPFEQRVDVPAQKTVRIDVTNAPLPAPGVAPARKEAPPKHHDGLAIDLSANFVLGVEALSFGSAGCVDDCSRSLALGGLGTARLLDELDSGLAFGGELGAMILHRKTSDRGLTLSTGAGASTRATDETTSSTSALLGGAMAFRWLDEVPLTIGLSSGVGLGQITAERSGTFSSSEGTAFEVDSSERHFLFSLYAAPSFRASIPVGEAAEVALEMRAIFSLVPVRPRWTNDESIDAAEDGAAEFAGDEPLTSLLAVYLAPGFAFRYPF